MTYLEGKPWVSSTASTESNPFLSSSPATRRHTIAFIDQRALMKSALAVVYASLRLWTVSVHISMSLWKSVTFYQQFLWNVAGSRPWVPLFACLVSCPYISLSERLNHAAVLPSALGVGVYSSIQGLNYSLHSQSWVLGPPTGFQLPFHYSQEEGKGLIILFCSNVRSWFEKHSETLDKINSTTYFDLRFYWCSELADLYASAHNLADRCLEILQRDQRKIR